VSSAKEPEIWHTKKLHAPQQEEFQTEFSQGVVVLIGNGIGTAQLISTLSFEKFNHTNQQLVQKV
jgi:hypothetical protein